MERVVLFIVVLFQILGSSCFAQEKLHIKMDRFAGGFHGLEFSHDGKMVVTTSGLRDANAVEVWNLETKECIQRFQYGRDGGPCFAGFSPSDETIQVLKCKVTKVFLGWDVQECNVKTGERKTLFSSAASEKPLTLWMDKKIVVTDGTVADHPKVKHALKFLNFENNKLYFIPFEEPFEVMAFSPDRKRVVLRQGKTLLRVIDWADNKKVSEFQTSANMGDECCTCAFLPDNKTLLAMVIGLFPKTQVWNVDTGKLSKIIDYRGFSSNRPVVSTDGRLFATFGAGLAIVETKHFSELARITVLNNRPVEVLRFSPDGTMLLGGDRLGNLRTFDIPKLDRP